jgi:hypothetical protein
VHAFGFSVARDVEQFIVTGSDGRANPGGEAAIKPKPIKRALIWLHRWLGIGLGLVIVVWFASGIAMIYVGGMPRLSPQQRLDHQPLLELAQVRLTAAEAAARLGGEGGPPLPG